MSSIINPPAPLGIVVVSAKGLALQNAGAPVDIGQIVVPYARWKLAAHQSVSASMSGVIGTTGTFGGASTVQVFTGANGTGSGVTGQSTTVGSGGFALFPAASANGVFTATTIYVRQNTNDGGGVSPVCDVYLAIIPLV